MEFGFRQESARPAVLDQQAALNRELRSLNDSLGSGLLPDPAATLDGRTARLAEAAAREGLDDALGAQHDAARRIADAAQTALGGVTAALDDLAATFITGNNGGAQPGTSLLGDQAEAVLADVARLMNTASGRDFVFSGATSRTPPIDLGALDTLTTIMAAYVPTATPALNDQFDAFIAANPGLLDAVLAGSATPRATVTGPLGDLVPDALTLDRLGTRETLSAVLRAVFVASKADPADAPGMTDALQTVVAGLKTAVDTQASGQARLGAFEARLDRSETFLETRRTLLQNERRDALAADPFETSVALFQAQSQLEASIDALARILSLDIADRLR